QGLVHERRGGEVVAVHGAHDSFDLQALFSDGQARMNVPRDSARVLAAFAASVTSAVARYR
ncbi:hypothetical protein SB776_37245, partial [Burkholderia sp. SIMBA_045]